MIAIVGANVSAQMSRMYKCPVLILLPVSIIAVSQLLELELSAGSIPIPSSRSLLLSSLSMSESLTGIRSSGFSSHPIAHIGSCMYNASNPLGSCICILLSEFTLNLSGRNDSHLSS